MTPNGLQLINFCCVIRTLLHYCFSRFFLNALIPSFEQNKELNCCFNFLPLFVCEVKLIFSYFSEWINVCASVLSSINSVKKISQKFILIFFSLFFCVRFLVFVYSDPRLFGIFLFPLFFFSFYRQHRNRILSSFTMKLIDFLDGGRLSNYNFYFRVFLFSLLSR